MIDHLCSTFNCDFDCPEPVLERRERRLLALTRRPEHSNEAAVVKPQQRRAVVLWHVASEGVREACARAGALDILGDEATASA